MVGEPITFEQHKVQVSGPMATHEVLTRMGVVNITEVIEGGVKSLRGTWRTPELFHADCMMFVNDGQYVRVGEAYFRTK